MFGVPVNPCALVAVVAEVALPLNVVAVATPVILIPPAPVIATPTGT